MPPPRSAILNLSKMTTEELRLHYTGLLRVWTSNLAYYRASTPEKHRNYTFYRSQIPATEKFIAELNDLLSNLPT